MTKPRTFIGIAGMLAIAWTSTASADSGLTILLEGMSCEAFGRSAPAGTLAWAGEDETYAAGTSLIGPARQAVSHDDAIVDPELLTGLPAPEPPAIVLAGLAFGGVLCGRSLLARRRQADGEAGSSESKS